MTTVSVRYIVDDVDAAIEFYTKLLGFRVELHPTPGFASLSRGGFRLLLNEPGAGTLHYSVEDIAVNTNMADWIPQWCFHFLKWSLRNHGGRASLKLDWFAGRGITPAPGSRPHVVGDLRDDKGRLSDHDAIVLEFLPSN